MLEGSIKTIIADTERRENVARSIVMCLFDVVILKIQKLIIIYGAFCDLSMKECSKRPYFFMSFAVLNTQVCTSFNF